MKSHEKQSSEVAMPWIRGYVNLQSLKAEVGANKEGLDISYKVPSEEIVTEVIDNDGNTITIPVF